MRQLAWGKKVSAEFRAGVFDICSAYKWTGEVPNYFMSCMAFESGQTFDPGVKNAAGSGATGLIQFMPKTAISLGTTVEQLARMTAVEQLEWVKKYFAPYKDRVHTLSDFYMAILLPKFVGKPEASVLFNGGEAYRQNSGLDVNKDGLVTKLEAASKVQRMYEKGMGPQYLWQEAA